MLQSTNQHTADSHLKEGNTFLAQNELSAAIAAYQRALELAPNFVEAHYNCGVAYHQQGHLKLAVQSYNQALQLYPHLAEAYFNLASAYSDLNRFDESETAYIEVLRLQPENAAAAYNLGLVHKSTGKHYQAIERFEQALQIQPNYAEAANNIGVIYRDQDDFEMAMSWLQKALTIKNDFAVALYNIGVVYQKKGAFKEAMECYQKSLSIDAHYAPARWLYLLSLPMLYDVPDQIDFYRRRFSENLTKLIQTTPLNNKTDRQNALQGLSSASNFYLQYQGRNDLKLQNQYGLFATKVMAANFPQWAIDKTMPHVQPGEKIRVGYASSCMYSHTIGIFLLGWLGNASHSDFEWFCYHMGDRTDALTQRIAQNADHYYHFPGDMKGTAKQITDDKLHILVHTDIGMNPITLQLAALRLAPVQCKGWGHPVTTGLPAIDYYLSSDLMETDESQQHYSEKVIRLPNLALNYAPPKLPMQPKPREYFQIPKDAVAYLTTQSIFKYLPQHDDIFVEIAKQVPNAVFVFIAHKTVEVTQRFSNRLAKVFDAHNVPFNCIFLPRMQHIDFLSLNMNADVLLDSLEWSGGKTTLEAITCNLPVVTLPGEFMRGRHTYAFLTRMGITELIASDKMDYIRIAVQIGINPKYRALLKSRIIERKDLLFKDHSVNQALEKFFKKIIIEASNQQNLWA